MELKPQNDEPEVRVVTTASCASTSGKSKLGYQVGCAPDSEIQFRIISNTGTGAFSRDWVSLRAVQEALATAPAPGEITSFHLRSLYAGRSVNSPPFLLAALMSEGLVRPSTTKRRCYECVDDAAFAAAVNAWKEADRGDGGESAPKKRNAKLKGAAKAAPRKPKSNGSR